MVSFLLLAGAVGAAPTASAAGTATTAAAVPRVTEAAVPRLPVPGPRGVDMPINILNAGSGKCVEVADSSSADGAPVQQGDCAGQPGARWLLRTSSVGGGAVLVVNARSGKCLAVETRTVPGGPSGPRIEQWSCTGHPGVNFLLDSRDEHAWIRSTRQLYEPCLGVGTPPPAPAPTGGAARRD
ncbi:RICIN domain-containing protein [Streptomyces flavofungini]|uniref:RICIN domain-containing protein n=1 Tax=Streptomyces flavofungini TaxID=68200 RepID=UPI0034DEB4D1